MNGTHHFFHTATVDKLLSNGSRGRLIPSRGHLIESRDLATSPRANLKTKITSSKNPFLNYVDDNGKEEDESKEY